MKPTSELLEKSMAILYEVQDAPGEGLRECCFVKVGSHNSLINDRVLIFHLQLMTIQSIPSILIDQMCVVL